MATKKYVSLEKLGIYDGKIKELITAKDGETLQSAKSYADGLAVNYDAAGAAATAESNAKSYTDTEVAKANAAAAAAKTQADKGVADAATAQAAAEAAQASADAAQADVDALETYVGTIPEGATATDVVGYIQEKTSGIATDAALAELQTQVNTNKGDIATIKGDYLKAADKTELQGNIDAVDDKVDVLVGTDTGKSVRAIANAELAAQLIPENAKESLDTLQEIAAWIQAHPDDASAMNQAIDALEALVGTIPESATASDIVGYIQEVVAAEQTRATGVESGLDTRLQAIEGKFGGADGSVEDMIADAKQEAIDTAAADATAKANQALADAKTYANGLDTAMDARVDALEAVSHSHANKALLDTYTQTEADLADAVAKKHSHANATVLDGITADKVSAWDKVADKADQTALQAEIDRATAAETALGARIDEFVEVSEAEINALFA